MNMDNNHPQQPERRSPRPGVPRLRLQAFPRDLYPPLQRGPSGSSSGVPALRPTHDDVGAGYRLGIVISAQQPCSIEAFFFNSLHSGGPVSLRRWQAYVINLVFDGFSAF